MNYKKMFYAAVLAAFFILVGLIVVTTKKMEMSESHEKQLRDLNTTIKIKKEENFRLRIQVAEHKAEIKSQDVKIVKQDSTIKASKIVSDKKIEQIKTLSTAQLISYINSQTNGDTLTMAIYLQERENCIEMNDLLLIQNSSLRSRIQMSDTVIKEQDLIISNSDVMIDALEKKTKIYEDEYNRAKKKLKRAKILNKVLIGGIIVVGIIGGAN